MKISNIIEKTTEYQKLQDLIDNIETALENFNKIKTVVGNVFFGPGYITLLGDGVTDGKKEERVDTILSGDVNDLIRDDMKLLLKKHLKALKDEQNALEI